MFIGLLYFLSEMFAYFSSGLFVIFIFLILHIKGCHFYFDTSHAFFKERFDFLYSQT